MINLKEVRFGNFFESIVPLSGSYAEKQRVKGNIFSVNNNSMFDLNFIKFLRPIKLTEDWILKFDLFQKKENCVTEVNFVEYHKGSNEFNYAVCSYYNEDGFVEYSFKEIKFVHQLQNLFFALTGNELECKL